MATRKDATESGTRTVNTFALLGSSAHHALKAARSKERGRFYDCLHCVVSTAFMIEAYLNHLGPTILSFWDSLERLPARRKLDIVCDVLKVKPDFGIRPFQSFVELFRARALAAHGRTETLSYERRVTWGDDDHSIPTTSKLEQYCTLETAEQLFDDGSAIVETLHKAAGLETLLLWNLGQTQYVKTPDVDTA